MQFAENSLIVTNDKEKQHFETNFTIEMTILFLNFIKKIYITVTCELSARASWRSPVREHPQLWTSPQRNTQSTYQSFKSYKHTKREGNIQHVLLVTRNCFKKKEAETQINPTIPSALKTKNALNNSLLNLADGNFFMSCFSFPLIFRSLTHNRSESLHLPESFPGSWEGHHRCVPVYTVLPEASFFKQIFVTKRIFLQ